MSRTLIRHFFDTVESWHKPAQFLRRAGPGWEAISADRARADVGELALGLRRLGLRPGDRVALLSENRYEWALADLAVVGQGAVSVPVYATLTAEQCRHILADSGAKLAVVSTAAQLAKVRAARAGLAELETVVVMEPGAAAGAGETAWETLVRDGAAAQAAEPGAFEALAAAVKPDDLATLIYTSGTTGEPKGVMLTHANISTNAELCLKVIELGPSDLHLSFLPLSHVFERMAGLYTMLTAGVTIAFAESPDTVAADAAEVRPTVITGVPRFFEKVRARVIENANAQPLPRRAIFHWALGRGLLDARARLAGRPVRVPLSGLADRLVGAKVRARLGGRLRFVISGGAPLHPAVMEFFFAMGIRIIEGYGLTETSPVICLTPLGREKPGSVGPVVPGIGLRIAEDGEILTRGPCVMRGYWRDEEATARALRDGWFHTGDAGRLDAEGYLFITDRLKDLLVTAGGKNVAPQPIENRLRGSKWITEAVLIGDRRPYVTALLVPEFTRLERLARAQGWPFSGRAELLVRPEIRAIFQRRVDRLNATLAPFETIKRFALLEQDLTQEGGELTPTLKVKRRVVLERFAGLIESLYASPPEPAGP